jgi:ABC-2 type transport system ATP-binding protein
MSAIATENLSKTFRSSLTRRREVRALSEVSLSVEQGEIFGLLGPNGAGKTTFIKILLALTHPTLGSASVFGEPASERTARSRIGYLPENHRFPSYLTGGEALSFFGRLSGLNSRTLASAVPRMLELVGMAQWKGMRVKRYSKGMLQRLGLAQALLHNPDLLFLDEPTDGVDPVGRKEIRDILRSLRNEGKTIFLNSHLLSEVEMISDRVAVLNRGSVAAVGTVEELTRIEARYVIGVDGEISEDVRLEIQGRAYRADYAPGSLTVEIRTHEDLNRLIDLLRHHGVMISAITPQRASLEDSFMNLVRAEGGS